MTLLNKSAQGLFHVAHVTVWTVLGYLFAAGLGVSAASLPEMEISNGPIHLRLYLPDTQAGL